MRIKGIIFDFDGLILDTETPELTAWEIIYEKHNVDFPYHAYYENIGAVYSDQKPLRYLLEHSQKQLDGEIITAIHRKILLDAILSQSTLPGVRDYLESAKEIGLKIGLASSANREWINMHIDRLGITSYFDTILTRDDVIHPKPNPELFEKSLISLDIDPKEAIALEDSINGVTAAKSAGIFTIAVPNPITKRFAFEKADLVIDSLAELEFSKLIDLAAASN